MDNADVDAVLQNYQQGPTPTKMMWSNGDFNGDEAVGEDDLQIVEPALPASLVAYWRLDEGSGTTACNLASGSDNITIRAPPGTRPLASSADALPSTVPQVTFRSRAQRT